MDESNSTGAVSPRRFALGIAAAALQVILVILLGTGGVKFFYQGF